MKNKLKVLTFPDPPWIFTRGIYLVDGQYEIADWLIPVWRIVLESNAIS